jgi:hypothetical protein
MSAGDLTKEEVEGIRSGRVRDPSVAQIAALAAVFGVEPPTWLTTRSCPHLTRSSLRDCARRRRAR